LHTVTPLEGLKHLGVKHTFAPGVPVFGAIPHAESTIVSKTGDSVEPGQEALPVRLEWFNGNTIGEGLAHEQFIPNAEYMIKEAWPEYLHQDYCTRLTFDVTPRTTGFHTLSVITTGRAICYVNSTKVYDRIQETDLRPESFYFFKSKLERRFTHQLEAGKKYTFTLESWATEPAILHGPPIFGKMFQGAALRFFEYVNIPESISSAASLAKASDYAVVCVGTTNEIESEGYDRDTMDLPGQQYDLILAVAAANPRTVVVNFSGAPINFTRFVDKVSAIIQAWFPGQECGHSIAQVLTGLINPSGHLPMSWPKRVEDNPSFGNFPADSNGLLRYEEGLDVGYRFYDKETSPEPLFPFGFGLSYTTFEVSDVTGSGLMTPGRDGKSEISCLVRNTGTRPGKVAVQFYVQFPQQATGAARPLKELKAFEKVELAAAQETTVKVILDKDAISFYDAEIKAWRAQKGEYVVLVGTSTKDIRGKTTFEVPQEFTWTGV
jgi:beta-glucosidase